MHGEQDILWYYLNEPVIVIFFTIREDRLTVVAREAQNHTVVAQNDTNWWK